MNTNTQRVLVLFAATALTAGSLVACAPQASTNTGSQKSEPSATSQSGQSGSSTQPEQKPTESTSSATSTQQTSTSQTEQPNTTTTDTTIPETAPSQAGVTGWLIGVCLDSSSATSPAVTSITLSNDTLTVEGAMAYSESMPQSIPTDRNSWITGPMTFSVNESTKWQGRGGEAGTVDIDSEQLIQVVNSHNGLGLLIQAEGGVVKSITLAS